MDKHINRLWVFLIFVAFAASTTFAATFYVATDGQTENNGSLAKPWPSVEYALSRVGAGNTIIVRPGLYGSIYIRKLPGAAVDRPTIIKSEIKWKAVVIGGDSEGIGVVDCPGMVIDGFEVTGSRKSGIGMNTDSGTVRNCWVHNNGHMGISSHKHKDVTIEANLVEFNGCNIQFHHGVYADGERLTVCCNIIRHNSGFGLHLYPSIKDSVVRQNLIYGHNHNPGIIVACPPGGGKNLIVNNTVVDNESCLAIWNGDGERVFNNIFVSASEVLSFNNTTKNISADYNLCQQDLKHQGPHSFTADPQFVRPDSKIFWLKPDSPAIGKGTPEYAQPTDFWSRPSPPGKLPDIGAFAFVPSLATGKAIMGWHSWPYRFTTRDGMELPDMWALPDPKTLKEN